MCQNASLNMESSSMKFLFISVQKTMDVIGLKCLHYTLIANSFKSSILFTPALNLADDSLDELGKFVDDMAPDIIGFSVMTIDVNPAAGLSMYLKEHFPGIPIIWGGASPHGGSRNVYGVCRFCFNGGD